MAHRIVWWLVADTSTTQGRPRLADPASRFGVGRNETLGGWMRDRARPYPDEAFASPRLRTSRAGYWTDVTTTLHRGMSSVWHFDDESRSDGVGLSSFKLAPALRPVDTTPSIVPAWDAPTSDSFARVLRLRAMRAYASSLGTAL